MLLKRLPLAVCRRFTGRPFAVPGLQHADDGGPASPLPASPAQETRVAAAASASARLRGLSTGASAGGARKGRREIGRGELRRLLRAAADASDGESEQSLQALLGLYDRHALDGGVTEEFFHLLADELAVKSEAVERAMGAWNSLMERAESADSRTHATLRGVKLLQEACQPPYVAMFRRIGHREGGIHLLVRMRAELMAVIQRSPATAAPLRAVSESLRSLLADWFSVGIMRLERISWETSPAATLEKVVAGEAVHSIRGWRDLRRRLGPSKRVFAFFHPSMPDEPLVILHTALCCGIAGRMSEVILASEGFERPPRGDSAAEPTTAVFYSISSTQAGLKGVELGNFLIKQAVANLQAELPSLQTLVTLSPIPGFRNWLEERMHRELHTAADTWPLSEQDVAMRRPLLTPSEVERCIAGLLPADAPTGPGDVLRHTAAVAALQSALAANSWQGNHEASTVLKPVLMRLCATYLLHERRRQFALDAVANFHLRNGAWLWRINWASDASTSGNARSYGMMVNYRYILEDIERNNKVYEADGHINASEEVIALAQGELL